MSTVPPIIHPWFDSTRAPLYIWTFPPAPSDDELLACCAARDAWARRCTSPVAWVVDLSNMREATARQRRIFGDHLERFEAHDVAYNRGSAIVVPNPFLRGVVTAVFWLKPPRFPHQLVATRDEAIRWAEGQLSGSAS